LRPRCGTEAIEERARYELGMVKHDEVFFQLADPAPPQPRRD
jgi:cell division protein FtsB